MKKTKAPAKPVADVPSGSVATWSRTYPTRDALDKDEPTNRAPASLEHLTAAALEQFDEARKTVFDVLDLGIVGEGECVITLSGHANPGHVPKNGRPNDRLSISIQQVGS